jgi:hypothetical protein
MVWQQAHLSHHRNVTLGNICLRIGSHHIIAGYLDILFIPESAELGGIFGLFYRGVYRIFVA